MSGLARATATPLASIFGSGFLVIIPILAAATGSLSVLATLLVTAVAYSDFFQARAQAKLFEKYLGGSLADIEDEQCHHRQQRKAGLCHY